MVSGFHMFLPGKPLYGPKDDALRPKARLGLRVSGQRKALGFVFHGPLPY